MSRSQSQTFLEYCCLHTQQGEAVCIVRSVVYVVWYGEVEMIGQDYLRSTYLSFQVNVVAIQIHVARIVHNSRHSRSVPWIIVMVA